MPGEPSAWRSGLTLAVLAAVCTALVALTWRLTAPRIAENEQAALEHNLSPTIADLLYDSDLTKSVLLIPPPHELPGTRPVSVYRVWSEGDPAAAVFVVEEPAGYSGPIRLLIGIEYSGKISGVRVLSHRETPGLGDQIESSKSDWLEQFQSTSLESPPRGRWAVQRDDGAFDQVTGATITSRAVVRAIKQTLLYFEAHRDFIFAAEGAETTKPEHDQSE
ncbi:MAG TPA: electron transport complex subunit RsxG [Woeseiaceae bacterium]|nr:electron transport complex subunit RsxG [Woeseiaceae bacterium]